jgi:signal transduction histidine kinase/CheY-like chemotaxis protein
VRAWFVVGSLALAYGLAFVVLQPRIGDAVVSLSIIPVIASAWFYGLRGGVISSLVCVVANIALMQTLGDHDGFRTAQLPRIAIAVAIGATTGWARELTLRQRTLLVAVERAAIALHDAKNDLERLVSERTAELTSANVALTSEIAARREAEDTIRRDLEARKQLEARVAAADRMAVVGTLTAGIGHEINNPLAVIIASLTYVGENLRDVDPGTLDALRDAQAAARRAGEIVQNMRVFVQSNNSVDFADVRRVVTSTVQMVSNEIRHRARLELDIVDTPHVALPESQLGQIMLNLLTNAAHALPDNADSVVRIEVRCIAEKIRIRVSDTGTGIPADLRTRIFEPFFTTKPIGVGTGLGLWVCHHIVTSAGGHIELEESSDHGTTFRIELPISRPSLETLPTLPTPIGKLRGRVLVIDDDTAIRKSIGRYIKHRHELVAVESAIDAMALLEAGDRFDVILCDMMMPDMDGAELYERLVVKVPEQAARMIFMTGGAFTPRTKSFLAPKDRRLLEKPFEAVQLEAMIQEVLAA